MALTSEQLQLLKADILADSSFIGKFDDEIAGIYNQVAVPDFHIWKSDVDPVDIMKNGMDWTMIDNLTVGKARIWEWMTKLGTFDASKPNIRAGIDAAWVGTAAMLAVRAQIYTHCNRVATRGEKVLATGTGTTASPATASFEGQLTYHDIELARTS